MSKDAITITLPLPPKELSPNARVHWAGKARKVKYYRGRAWAESLAVQGRRTRKWKRATVQATFYHRDKRRRDKDNLLASLKSAFDGIADADVVENDAGLTHLPVECEVDKSNPRVVITVAAEQEQ